MFATFRAHSVHRVLFRFAAALTLGLGLPVAATAQPCPDPALSARPITFNEPTLASGPQSLWVTAGGNLDLGACASVPGHGRIVDSPDFEITLTSASGTRPLNLSVDGACDTVLLVRDPFGAWHFNDDAGGTLDPAITLPGAGNGTYDIWVGTFSAGFCLATLNLEMGPGLPPPATSTFYDVPRVRGEIVDWCVTWATDCGQPGADNFCRARGHDRATGWERFPGQRTLVLGDDRICPAGCDGLRNVTCEGGPIGGVAPADPAPATQLFPVPRVDGEIVDWCVTWATDCGQPGADNFCRLQGFSGAASWERFPGQRTLVLGDSRICPGGCDGLRNVVCVR